LVIGAGLAGAAVADAFVRRGAEVCVVETGRVGGATSSVPCAVLQPIMGMRASVSSLDIAGFNYARTLLDELDPDGLWQRRMPLVRLAPSDHEVRLWQRKLGSLDTAIGAFIPADMMSARCTDAASDRAGIWIPNARFVVLQRLVRALLRRSGAEVWQARVVEVDERPSDVRVIANDGVVREADVVVVAANRGAVALPVAAPYAGDAMHGEVAVFDVARAPSMAVGLRGVVAPMGQRSVLVGATYNPGLDHAVCTLEGAHTLRERLEATLNHRDKATMRTMWSGVRSVTPSYAPVVGLLPPSPGRVWGLLALGSRGLLAGLLAADLLAADVLHGSSTIPERWRPRPPELGP